MVGNRCGGLRRDLPVRLALSADRAGGGGDRLCRRPFGFARLPGSGRPCLGRRQAGGGCRNLAGGGDTRPCPADAGMVAEDLGDLPRPVVRADPAAGAIAGVGQRLCADRAVLLQDGGRHLRRRLRGAGLCGAAGGRELWLAPARRDAGWLGHGGDDAGAADHGAPVRGFMGAFRDPGGLPPLLAGTLAGLLATWVTFVPCFLWIFLGAPSSRLCAATAP